MNSKFGTIFENLDKSEQLTVGDQTFLIKL
jgi:hypothetical protein